MITRIFPPAALLLSALTLVDASWRLEALWEQSAGKELNMPLDTAAFAADNSNTSGWGAVAFHGDRVYALAANNGILAFQIADAPGGKELVKQWELTPDDSEFLSDSGYTERGLAVNPLTGNVLFVHRISATEVVIPVLSGETGAQVGELSVEGIRDGSFALSLIDVADDGAIYAANLVSNSGLDAFKVYRWENENALPTVAYQGDPSEADPIDWNRRFGDAFAVRGSGTDTEWVATTRGTLAAVFTTEDGTTFTSTRVAVAGIEDRQMERSVTFGEGNRFITKSTGGTGDRPLLEISFDLETETGEVARRFSADAGLFPGDASPIDYDPASDLLGAVLRDNTFSLYRYGDLSETAGIDYLSDSGNRQRGLAVSPVTGNVFLVNRITNSDVEVVILDGETGAPSGTLSVDGVEGGTFALSLIGTADDGAIYAANMVNDSAASPFTIYRWENESATPAVVYEGDPSEGDANAWNRRFGETFAVRGSGAGTEIVATTRGTLAAVWTTADGSTFTSTAFLPAGVEERQMERGLAFSDGNRFFAKSTGGDLGPDRPLLEIEYDLQTGEAEVVRSFTSENDLFPFDVSPIGVDLTRRILGAITRGNENDPQAFLIYDLDTLSSARTNQAMDQAVFATQHSNAAAWGAVVFTPAGRVYALSANNGIAAFELIEVAAPRSYAEWRALHFSPAEQADDAVSGPDADLTGEGVSNLLRYAIGLSPREPALAALPKLVTDGDGAALYWQRRAGITDIDVYAEYSTDLLVWTAADEITMGETITAAGEVENVVAELDLGQLSRLFLRVAVVHEP